MLFVVVVRGCLFWLCLSVWSVFVVVALVLFRLLYDVCCCLWLSCVFVGCCSLLVVVLRFVSLCSCCLLYVVVVRWLFSFGCCLGDSSCSAFVFFGGCDGVLLCVVASGVVIVCLIYSLFVFVV